MGRGNCPGGTRREDGKIVTGGRIGKSGYVVGRDEEGIGWGVIALGVLDERMGR